MRPIGNSPLETTTLRLEQNKSFSFSVQLMEEGRAPIDTSDCTIRLDFNDQTIVAAYEGDGRSRLDIQASHVQHTGSYPYSVTLIAHSGYSTTIMKGSLDVLPNADQNIETYSATTPPTGVEIFLRGQQVVQIAAAPQLPPELSGARAARIDGRGHLILTLDNGSELDVGLVKGEKGDQGLPAAPVKQLYTWTKYADTPTSGMSNSPDGKVYRGQAFNKESPDESNNYADYTWERIQGPPGPPGVDGSPGIPGADGFDGTTLYTWLKYADTPTSGMSDDPEGKPYMGLAYNQVSPIESNNYEDYYWSLIEGPAGRPGDDGQMLYTWVRYATGPNGEGMSNLPDGKVYIGLAFNKDTPVESENPADYTWSLFRGTSFVSLTSFFRAVPVGAGAPARPTTMNPSADWVQTEPDFSLMMNLYRTERVVYSDDTFAWSPVSKVQGNFGSMYVAGMVQASTHVGSTAPAEPFEGQMWWVTNASNNFAGLRRYNGSTWQNYTVMADTVIAANSIEGQNLKATFSVAANKYIQAGETSSGFYTRLTPTGLRFYSQPKTSVQELLQINSPGLDDTDNGSGGVIFNLRNPADLKQSLASIDEDGNAAFQTLSVNKTFVNELTVDGDPFESYFEPFPTGAVLYGAQNVRGRSVTASANGSAFIALGEFDLQLRGGDTYQFSTSNVSIYLQPSIYCTIEAHYTTNGSKPTFDSPVLSADGGTTVRTPQNQGSTMMHALFHQMQRSPGVDERLRLLYALRVTAPAGYSGTSGNNTTFDSASNSLLVYVTNLGRRDTGGNKLGARTEIRNSTGTSSGGGDPAPPPVKKDYDKTWAFSGSSRLRSYNTSGGDYYAYYGAQAAHGSYGGKTFRGLLWFGNLKSALSGVDISRVDIYLYTNHWYYNAGGTATVAYWNHGTGSIPGSIPSSLETNGSGGQDFTTTKPGGVWVKMPTAMHALIKSGACTGAIVSGSGLAKYGYEGSFKIRVRGKV